MLEALFIFFFIIISGLLILLIISAILAVKRYYKLHIKNLPLEEIKDIAIVKLNMRDYDDETIKNYLTLNYRLRIVTSILILILFHLVKPEYFTTLFVTVLLLYIGAYVIIQLDKLKRVIVF